MNDAIQELRDSNKRLASFLGHYCKTERPGFAVLLQGEWGCGKTWLLHRLISIGVIQDPIYISLYGISSKAELDSSLFAACFPSLTSTPARMGFGVARMIASRIRINWTEQISSQPAGKQAEPQWIQELLTKTSIAGRVVIFDDLERCGLKPSETLSVCNLLIQESECKVILLANEKLICEGDQKLNQGTDVSYARQKEKVIGFTFTVQPEVESALDAFKSDLPAELHRFDLCKLALGVHQASGYNNLRYLRATFSGFSWLYKDLPESSRSSSELISALFSIYAICQHELQNASVTTDSLQSFLGYLSSNYQSYFANSNNSARDEIASIAAKYHQLKTGGTILDAQLWVLLFKEGTVDPSLLNEDIQRYFNLEQNKPAWHRLLDFWDLRDEEFRQGLESLLEDIAHKRLFRTGEILHAAGLLILFHELGVYKDNHEVIYTTFAELLDSLIADERLEPRNYSGRAFSREDISYAGYQFPRSETSVFKDILTLVQEAETSVLANEYQRAAEVCLQQLSPDTLDAFVACLGGKPIEVTTHLGTKQEIDLSDALTFINPSCLASRLLCLRPGDARQVLYMIAQFYKHRLLGWNTGESEEGRWLSAFAEALNTENLHREKTLERLLLAKSAEEYIHKLVRGC